MLRRPAPALAPAVRLLLAGLLCGGGVWAARGKRRGAVSRVQGRAECRGPAGPRGSGPGRVRDPCSVQGGGLSAGVARGGGVVGKVGRVLQSRRASGFGAECGNRARARGSVLVRALYQARFGSECGDRAEARGSERSARILLGKVWVRVRE